MMNQKTLDRSIARKLNLASQNLSGLDLSARSLKELNFSWCSMQEMNLQGSSLRECNLAGAVLARTNLQNVWFNHCNLRDTILTGVNLKGAYGLNPVELLRADWLYISPALTRDLMRYDAFNHPKPELFLEWAKGGNCPYEDQSVTRVANFHEDRNLITKRFLSLKPQSAYALMIRLFKENGVQF